MLYLSIALTIHDLHMEFHVSFIPVSERIGKTNNFQFTILKRKHLPSKKMGIGK